jgi:hypothetical protein
MKSCTRNFGGYSTTLQLRLEGTPKLLPKNIRDFASQSVHEVFKRVDRNVLLHHFNALERGIRQANFASKLVECLIAAPLSEKFGQLLAKLIAHGQSVRLSASHMWDNKCLHRLLVSHNHGKKTLSQRTDGTQS